MKGQKLAVLKALRQAGTTGLTKREIRDMCGAENVAQRIKELRDEDGYTIQLVWDKLPHGKRAGRYVLHAQTRTSPTSLEASTDGGLFDLDTYRGRSSTPHYLSDVEAA